jgi:hypothetical protein
MPWNSASKHQPGMTIRLIPLAESWSERRVGAFWNPSDLNKIAERFLMAVVPTQSFPVN